MQMYGFLRFLTKQCKTKCCGMYTVHTYYIVHTVHTLCVNSTYIVHTIAFTDIPCTYILHVCTISMRSTSGCSSLGAESHAWVVLRLRRLPIGSLLRTLTRGSVWWRIVSNEHCKSDRAWWKIKVCLVHVRTRASKSIDRVCILYLPTLLPSTNHVYSIQATQPTSQHHSFLNRTDRYAFMYR